MDWRDWFYVFWEMWQGGEMGNTNQEEETAFFNQYFSIPHSSPPYSQAFGNTLNTSIKLQFQKKKKYPLKSQTAWSSLLLVLQFTLIKIDMMWLKQVIWLLFQERHSGLKLKSFNTMMQSKAIVLKLHGGSSDDISPWGKKK